MNSVEWARYHMLRDLIAEAVDEAVDYNEGWPDGQVITLAISPDLQSVHATFLPCWNDEPLADVIGTDWHIETAGSVEEADFIADMYFDLR